MESLKWLPHDVIEHHILERLDVKTLVKFKCVSKQWKSTIQSPCFQNRQLIQHRRQSRDPQVLLVSLHDAASLVQPEYENLTTLVVGSSSSSSVSVQILATPWEETNYLVCNTSCDGLICLYDFYRMPSIVVNPTTRWHQTIPQCNYQLVATERGECFEVTYPSPGFGKDKINGTYKPVWLYNSAELGLNNNATTCEVFDFATNSWRYLVPASPYLIVHMQSPVYLDGSLHWFTAQTFQVLSLDLHTETFQVISKAHPFLHASDLNTFMCNLDDRLCVSEEQWPNQVVWSFDSGHKTWNKIYSINLNITFPFFGRHILALAPLGILDKDKLLFYDRELGKSLVTHDPKTKSYHLAYTSKLSAYAVCYFPSLISIF